ncbi:MAG TPA: hypothetical protein VKA76_00285 [Gammaproteobacteria bacterium]|nr:hypothetical protein [Gammaproteobacteria bacterium]
MKLRTWMWLAATFGLGTTVLAADSERNIYHGSLESRVDALAAIQPGLGVVMHEVGYRFTNAYRAANGGNWGLAQYQLKELREALEVAEATRPQRAGMLKAFEHTHLDPVGEAIEKKNLAEFNPRFAEAVKGCNACHTALGMHFIRYRVPEGTHPGGLDFTLKTDPRYEESKESK